MVKAVTYQSYPHPEKDKEICAECNGEGSVPDTTGRFKLMKCPDCKGYGWVKQDDCDHKLEPYQINGVVLSRCKVCGWIK